ncbi:L,D-transpeptidase family protein [Granulicella mallensis]|uniref:ErfK/YbiS/YcfS/YnhG family protein n=1 Tax=Granulicella mallensis (strain ATCC BAA-1857 / DSM 23137 / MP5ACTX8) TaxID=682795 RepID=G8NZU7_GRAMM|nr:L,D-transpeptidase family protein [Granulicella mallensis]AEU34574.1 ErfK/YbiS/YcfS/YnhG family protein [Granulicella mallensis MP5ACTX8]
MKKLPSTTVRAALALAFVSLTLLSLSGCKGCQSAPVSSSHPGIPLPQPKGDTGAEVQKLIGSPQLAILKWPNYSDYQAQVQKFYIDRVYEPAWLHDGKPTSQATALIALFTDAAQKGLKPEDYDASLWPERVQKLAGGHGRPVEEAQFDTAMTISAMRYISDLHVGRVNPQSLNFDIDVPSKRAAFDLPAFLSGQVADSADVSGAIATVEPQNAMYVALQKGLAQYLELAKQQAANPQPPLPSLGATGAKSIVQGGSYAALPQLLARLQLEGDVTATDTDTAAASDTAGPRSYNAELVAAVKHYQQRHGLTADGKLTQSTIDSLNVPMEVRVQQLNNSLERWRWMPDNFINPRVLVNLPEFVVRAYDPDHSVAFKMKIVDGEAKGNHDTPMFVRSMRYVVFRPYWNVPPSIIKKELLPHIQRSGIGYLADKGYEVARNDGTVVTGYTAHDIEHLRYIVRQKPGPKNSLGLVKFLFPNEYDVYMHSTPELPLFNLTRRDRSHGCVRLEHADQMAAWVLQGQGDWDEDKISEAMNGDKDNKTVNLKTTLPVIIGYFTATADEDNSIHFFSDLYGYDKALEAALDKGMPYESAPVKINPKLVPGETE